MKWMHKRCEHGVLELNLCEECLPYNFISDGGYMSVDRELALKANWKIIKNLTLPGQHPKDCGCLKCQ